MGPVLRSFAATDRLAHGLEQYCAEWLMSRGSRQPFHSIRLPRGTDARPLETNVSPAPAPILAGLERRVAASSGRWLRMRAGRYWAFCSLTASAAMKSATASRFLSCVTLAYLFPAAESSWCSRVDSGKESRSQAGLTCTGSVRVRAQSAPRRQPPSCRCPGAQCAVRRLGVRREQNSGCAAPGVPAATALPEKRRLRSEYVPGSRNRASHQNLRLLRD